MDQKITWKMLLTATAKKLGILAVCVIIAILIQPLVRMKPYGQYLHAFLNLFFVFYIFGRVI
jgi:hypothetical protein